MDSKSLVPTDKEDEQPAQTSGEETLPARDGHRRRAVRARQRPPVFTLICTAVAVIMFIWSVCLFGGTVAAGAESAARKFQERKESVSENIRQKFYDGAFQQAEKKYHVRNRAAITLGNLREEGRLEVLEISGVEYIAGYEGKTNAWLQVSGRAAYTVDLRVAEYLIDEERAIVRIRLPRPVLSEPWVEKADILFLEEEKGALDQILEKTPLLGNHAGEGTRFADRQIEEGRNKIRASMLSNQSFYEYAKEAAETILTNLVKDLNADTPDLAVQIAFYDPN